MRQGKGAGGLYRSLTLKSLFFPVVARGVPSSGPSHRPRNKTISQKSALGPVLLSPSLFPLLIALQSYRVECLCRLQLFVGCFFFFQRVKRTATTTDSRIVISTTQSWLLPPPSTPTTGNYWSWFVSFAMKLTQSTHRKGLYTTYQAIAAWVSSCATLYQLNSDTTFVPFSLSSCV